MSRARTSFAPVTLTPCPDESTFLRVVTGVSEPAARERLVEHAADCADCATLLGEVARAEGATEPEVVEEEGERENVGENEGEAGGRYRIEGILGAGGTGIVYRAYDTRLERHVALKVLRKSAALVGREDPLLSEARVMARLTHPNVVRVFDSGLSDGRVFVAMELVSGGTLRSWLATERRSFSMVLDAFAQAAKGLGAAHRAGIVHRDFKPENLLVSHGRVLLTDFGLARATEKPPSSAAREKSLPAFSIVATTIAGTPAYMAPEHLRGESLDRRADIFSFCVALWEALYGKKPFASSGNEGVLRAIANGPKAPEGVALPEHLVRALRKGLSYDRADRHASIEAVMAECLATPAETRARLVRLGVVLGCLGLVLGARRWTAPARDHRIRAPGAAAAIEASARRATTSSRLRADVPANANAARTPAPGARISARPTLASPIVASSAALGPTTALAPASSRGRGAASMHGFRARAEPFGEETPDVLRPGGGLGQCAAVACTASPRGGGEIGDTHCQFHVGTDGAVSTVRCRTYVAGDREVACPAVDACFARVLTTRLPAPTRGEGDCVVGAYFVRSSSK